MFTIFKPAYTYTVEQIHEEFDTAQDRILDECDRILKDLNIPTETQVENKANLLESLGFVNASPIKEAEQLRIKKDEIAGKIAITSKQAEVIRDLKHKYSFEKFITTEELERICNKYGLIYAPVANYIKDVPEKNLLEILKAKKLELEDQLENYYIVSAISFMNEHTPEYINFVINRIINKPYPFDEVSEDNLALMCKEFNGRRGSKWWFNKASVTRIDKKGLFIAAPPSYFNLENLTHKDKQGYFKASTFEVNDPVVFEYCRDGMLRIITKWGTEDDQSYLDPALTNEKMN